MVLYWLVEGNGRVSVEIGLFRAHPNKPERLRLQENGPVQHFPSSK